MWRRVYRQRRRLLIGLGLFVLVGLMLTPTRSPYYFVLGVFAMPIAVLTVLAFVIILRPRWGIIVEILGATILLQELLFTLGPILEIKIKAAGVLLQLGLWFAIYYLLFNLVTGLNRLSWPGAATFEASRTIDARPERVWQALELKPGGAHWDPDVASVRPAPGADAVELVPVDLDGPIAPGTTERLLAADPGVFRHTLRNSRPLDPEEPEGRTDEKIRLEPHGSRTRVTLTRTHLGLPVVTAMRMWLEDQTGDALDDFAAIVEGRKNWSRAQISRSRRHRRLAVSG